MAIFVAAEHGLTVTGYPPATVKQAVVGHGRATKEQIGYLVRALLAMRRTPEPDAADALAIAICHARRAPRRRRCGAARMIAFLRGDIIGDDGDAIIVDVGGVGYQVLPSAATKAALPAVGRRRSCTSTRTSSPTSRCACTASRRTAEQSLFQTLLSVQGVGPRVALAILAGIETAELVRAIATSDVARLKQVKGVGGKTRRAAGPRAAREDPDRRGRHGRGKAPGRGRRRRAAAPASTRAGRAARRGLRRAGRCSATSRRRSSRCSRRWTQKTPVDENVRERAGGAAEGIGAWRARNTRTRRAAEPERAVSPDAAGAGEPGARRGRGAAAAQLRRVRRPAEDRREHGGLRPGGAQARRRAGSRAAVRAARAGQDDARVSAGARDGDRGARDVGAGAGAQGRPGRAADVARARRRPVHRRDPPPAAGDRGEPLPGDGGLPDRAADRHRRGRARDQPADRALHAGRRDDAHRPARLAAAGSLRHPSRRSSSIRPRS